MAKIDSEQKKVLPIVEYPEIPSQIIEAYNKKRLVIFIGAGVSRLVGCKGWDELAHELINKCHEAISEKNGRLFNYNTKYKLSQISDHRKIITICKKLLEREEKESLFYDVLKEALDVGDKSGKDNLIYMELFSLQAKYVTTNADDKFSRLFEEIKVIRNLKSINLRQLEMSELLHIHGSILDIDTLVFDLPSYFKRYSNSEFVGNLSNIFNNNTVLFLGYGLGELEILEFLFQKCQNPSVEPMYLLNGYLSSEQDYLKLEQSYYDSMNIKIIPFSLDRIGFKQLSHVIHEWVSTLHANTTLKSDALELIDEVVR